MITDKNNFFAESDSVVASAGTWTNVGDVIDRGAQGAVARTQPNTLVDLGGGEPLYLVIYVRTDILGTTDNTGTVTFRLVSDAAEPPASTGQTVHWESVAYGTDTTASAGISAGDTIAKIALPIEKTYEEHLGIQVLATTRATSAGTIDAFLTKHPENWQAYVDGQV